MKTLEEAKVGDLLAIDGGWSGIYIGKVCRVTPTLVFCGESKFNRDGRVPGQSGYSNVYARPATDIDLLNVRISIAKKRLSNFNVTKENIGLVEQLLKGREQ